MRDPIGNQPATRPDVAAAHADPEEMDRVYAMNLAGGLSAFDFAVAVAIGAIVGRGATASGTSFATSAIALVALLVAHRVVAIARRHSRVARLIDHPPRVLVARG
jgi:uncharacterized membrane protein YcaP (DUF421 family)